MSGIEKVTSGDVIERLYEVILSRKGGDPSTSYTASLFDKGLSEIARKVGEESSGGGGGTPACGVASPVVGDGRGVRTASACHGAGGPSGRIAR